MSLILGPEYQQQQQQQQRQHQQRIANSDIYRVASIFTMK
jgi:hypothetical protein